MGHIERVGLGLPHNAQAHHRDAVAAQYAAIVFGSPLHTGHVPQANQVTVASLSNHQPLEIGSGVEQAGDPHGELLAGRFNAAGRKLHVLGPKRLLDIGDGDLLCGHGLAV